MLHLLYPIGFVIALSLTVFIHEFGHYIVAIKLGVKAEEFSIGFGKILYSYTDKKGTMWCIRAFPLGGYVKLAGHDPQEKENNQMNQAGSSNGSSQFCSKGSIIKNLILLAGPLANYIFAILLFTIIFTTSGRIVGKTNIIGFTGKNSPAQQAGLNIGDIITGVESTKVTHIKQFQETIALENGKPVKVQYNRNGETLETILTPQKTTIERNNKKTSRYIIGIKTPNYTREKLSLAQAIHSGFLESINISYTSFIAIAQIIIGKRSMKDLSGPLQIAKHSGEALQNGITPFLFFLAFLSTGLGFFNLLPLPMLDGGQIIFYTAEGIYRKTFPQSVYKWFNYAGTIIIGLLIITAFFSDITALLG